MSDTETPPTWAIVELMGHVKIAGRLTEEEKFGSKIGRLDVPEGDGFTTIYFGGGSVYRISVCSEEVARHVSRSTSAAPVSPWDFPKPALTAAESLERGIGDLSDDDDDYEGNREGSGIEF